MLEIENIHTYYGLSHVLFGISMTVSKGEIVCLLGRNGAGKSTTMKSIIGITPPKTGIIRFKGEIISGNRPWKIARSGIGFVPDNRRIFADLTVEENLEISERNTHKGWTIQTVFDFFQPLKAIRNRKAGFLSGGEQQMLTIARALMTNPDLLLLDEPTEGLAPLIVEMLRDQIITLKEKGLTVLLAEQNVKMAIQMSDRAYVIDNGQIRYHGTIDELRQNEEICKKYLLV